MLPHSGEQGELRMRMRGAVAIGAALFQAIRVSSFPVQDPSAMPRPTSQDLAGFWDLLQLSIDDVTAKFDELQQIKSNHWQMVESPDKKVRLAAVFPVSTRW